MKSRLTPRHTRLALATGVLVMVVIAIKRGTVVDLRENVPELGRFVSPDILIPDPADPQSYNRYAYVHNNCLLDFGFSAEAGTQGMRDFGFQYQFEAAGIVQHRACQVN